MSATASEWFVGFDGEFDAASGLNPTMYSAIAVSRTSRRNVGEHLPIEVLRNELLSSGHLSRSGDPRQQTGIGHGRRCPRFARRVDRREGSSRPRSAGWALKPFIYIHNDRIDRDIHRQGAGIEEVLRLSMDFDVVPLTRS